MLPSDFLIYEDFFFFFISVVISAHVDFGMGWCGHCFKWWEAKKNNFTLYTVLLRDTNTEADGRQVATVYLLMLAWGGDVVGIALYGGNQKIKKFHPLLSLYEI
jgi:hypothetical protein